MAEISTITEETWLDRSCCLPWDWVIRSINHILAGMWDRTSIHQFQISKSHFNAIVSMERSQHARRVQLFVLIQKAHSLFAFFFLPLIVHVTHFSLTGLVIISVRTHHGRRLHYSAIPFEQSWLFIVEYGLLSLSPLSSSGCSQDRIVVQRAFEGDRIEGS